MSLERIFKVEAIPGFAARLYSLVAAKSPFMIDFRRELADELSRKAASGRILDVGTGPGYLPCEIAKRSEGFEVIGIDLSAEMVRIAARNVQREGLSSRIKFQRANAANLPFSEGYFDFVVSTLSLHHWQRPQECIQEINRVLKKGGSAFIYDLRQDTSKEVDAQVRNKYGWFLSFIFLVIVRLHSSISMKEAQGILDSSGAFFCGKQIKGKGIILELELIK